MIEFDPGSFKDPAGRVFHYSGAVYRTLSTEARDTFLEVRASGLLAALVSAELVVETECVSARGDGLVAADVGEFVLRQRRVPMVTYSYEWSFEMLRDAALTTLRILERVLAAGYILKDANAFNILFDGTRPALVDVPSIVRYRDGEIWVGYNQFCRSFLYPLLIAAYRDVDTQSLLRGELGELPAPVVNKWFRLRDVAKPGVFKDVMLQARLERSFAGSAARVKAAAASYKYPKAMLVANVRRLLTLIEDLRPPQSPGAWSRYQDVNSYSEDEQRGKAAFVAKAVAAAHGWSRIVDLGCNSGAYAEIAMRSGAHVVALDLDSRVIDRMYRRLPKTSSLTPVVASLLNPTPAMGWGLKERSSLFERVESDGFMALALIHHLRIAGGVPLDDIVDQLFRIAPEGIVEWVDKSDAMVSQMLSLRDDVYDDYTWPGFEASLRRHGEILSIQESHGGRRRLCHVRARNRPQG